MIGPNLLRQLIFALALIVGGAFAVPDAAYAGPYSGQASCKKKRKKRKKRSRRAKRTKAAKKKKLSAKTIKRWQKKGWSNAKIVKKAQARGYRVTKKERRKLKRFKVRKSLIAALSSSQVGAVASAGPAKPQAIDIESTIDPNDIDFDSVPPPAGMDMRFADAHRQEAEKRSGRR